MERRLAVLVLAGTTLALATPTLSRGADKDVRVTNTAAEPVPATLKADRLTHLRRRASDHVKLVGNLSEPTLKRELADGSTQASWEVPAGKVLVVTDMDWTQFTEDSSAGVMPMNLTFLLPDGSGHGGAFYANWDGKGSLVHGEAHIASGFEVAAGYHLSVAFTPNIYSIAVYGYLAADE
jgi:hypothetical protein